MSDRPDNLGTGGAALWDAVTDEHELDKVQLVQLEEACRAKDRCDRLDLLLCGEVDTWARLVHRTLKDDYELKIDNALAQANATANLMKQLLAAMRLPDESGKRPQRRTGPGQSGVHVAGGKVASLDRARARKSAAK